jgi:hypothetical protein
MIPDILKLVPFLLAAFGLVGVCLALPAVAAPVPAAEEVKPAPPACDPESARAALMVRLGMMVGGRWLSEFKGPDGLPVAELRFEWGPGKKTLRGAGLIAGQKVESWIGWDPEAKKVYYLDSHGPETIYFGHMALEGEEIVSRFTTIVGRPGTFKTRAWFPDPDTYKAVIESVNDGKPGQSHLINLHRAP